MQHILIVDDDDRICLLLSRVLKREGFITTTAFSVQQAEENALYFSFDAIITDVKMPEKSGYDFVKQIREKKTAFNILIPIMMLSAGWEKDQRIKGISLGADDYMVKPFEIDELIIRLKALLRRASSPSYETITQKDISNKVSSGSYTLEVSHNKIYYNEQSIILTHTESEFLSYLMHYPNSFFSRFELMMKFFPDQKDTPQSRALDVMIARLRRKISVFQDPNGCPLITKRNEGYGWQT